LIVSTAAEAPPVSIMRRLAIGCVASSFASSSAAIAAGDAGT